METRSFQSQIAQLGIVPGKTRVFIIDSCFLVNLAHQNNDHLYKKGVLQNNHDGKLIELLESLSQIPDAFILLPSSVVYETTGKIYGHSRSGYMCRERSHCFEGEIKLQEFFDKNVRTALMCDSSAVPHESDYSLVTLQPGQKRNFRPLTNTTDAGKFIMIDSPYYHDVMDPVFDSVGCGDYSFLGRAYGSGRMKDFADKHIIELCEQLEPLMLGQHPFSVTVLSEDKALRSFINEDFSPNIRACDTMHFIKSMHQAGYPLGSYDDPQSLASTVPVHELHRNLNPLGADFATMIARCFNKLPPGFTFSTEQSRAEAERIRVEAERIRSLDASIHSFAERYAPARPSHREEQNSPDHSPRVPTPLSHADLQAIRRQRQKDFADSLGTGELSSIEIGVSKSSAQRVIDAAAAGPVLEVFPLTKYFGMKPSAVVAALERYRDALDHEDPGKNARIPNAETLGKFCSNQHSPFTRCDAGALEDAFPLMLGLLEQTQLEKIGIRRRPDRLPNRVAEAMTEFESSYADRIATLKAAQLQRAGQFSRV